MPESQNRENKDLYKGIILMLISASLGCIGQMMWKSVVSMEGRLIFMIIGFGLYGLGAVAMIIALKHGPLSVLHPMNSAGYILSLFLGAFVLHEHITPLRILGVIVIALGLVVISREGEVLIESPYGPDGKRKPSSGASDQERISESATAPASAGNNDRGAGK